MSRKALLIALLASLALNTLLGGLMIGWRYAERHRGMPESATGNWPPSCRQRIEMPFAPRCGPTAAN